MVRRKRMEDSKEYMPCISVVLPVYNVAKYVRYAIEDVINQSYNNIEIIIIDDGSNDGSEDIVDEYLAKDSRITVFHQTNQGLSAARNKGIELSKGD